MPWMIQLGTSLKSKQRQSFLIILKQLVIDVIACQMALVSEDASTLLWICVINEYSLSIYRVE